MAEPNTNENNVQTCWGPTYMFFHVREVCGSTPWASWKLSSEAGVPGAAYVIFMERYELSTSISILIIKNMVDIQATAGAYFVHLPDSGLPGIDFRMVFVRTTQTFETIEFSSDADGPSTTDQKKVPFHGVTSFNLGNRKQSDFMKSQQILDLSRACGDFT